MTKTKCGNCERFLTPSGVRRGWNLCDPCRAEARRQKREEARKKPLRPTEPPAS